MKKTEASSKMVQGLFQALLPALLILVLEVSITNAFAPRVNLQGSSNIRSNYPKSKRDVIIWNKMTVDPHHLDGFISLLVAAEEASNTGVADAATSTDFSLIGEGNRGLSYYSTLALYALSFPGLWSTIQRSTTVKIKKKTYVSPSEMVEGGKTLRQQAVEIMAYMKANNYEVSDNVGETITFKGVVARSTSQAFFLTFCTALGMASLALVLQIQLMDFQIFDTKVNWFYLILLSPYAGIYYWKSGDRVDQVQVKMLTSDDNPKENEIIIQGSEEEMERMWRALELTEKGMIKVEGILPPPPPRASSTTQ